MKKKTKKTLVLICTILVSFMLINILGVSIAYSCLFNRCERPNYDITPGLVNYEEIKKNFPRENINFSSKNETLAGYYYKKENSKALVVISHGINDGADSLLACCIYFLENGYSVFSYDNSGCFDSSGQVNGFSQSLIDLKNALSFLNTDNKFKHYKKLLFGFSTGGYASTAIFNFSDFNILGSVSVSGYNDAKNLFFEKGKEYIGPLAYLGKFSVDILQKEKFDDYLNYTAISGINRVSTPIFLAHALNDKTINYEKLSIISQKDKVSNPNVTYYDDYLNDHTSILYSNEANIYQKEVNEKLKTEKNKKDYVSLIDDYLYSQLNNDLFLKITTFYDNCSK